MFNVNRSNNQFLYASTVIDSGASLEPLHGWVKPHGEKTSMENLSSNSNYNSNSNSNSNSNTNTNSNSNSNSFSNTNSINSSNITSVLNYNYKGIPLLYSTIIPGAYELTDIAELIKIKLMVML